MKFICNVTEIEPEGVVIVNIRVLDDPANVNGPNVEELGELTMRKSQWDMLKTMLVFGQGYFLKDEVAVEIFITKQGG